jgi:hypothetical protein
MTNYGMLINNATGRVLIDSMYRNYSLHDTGTLSCTAGMNDLNITSTSNAVLIAIQPSTNGYSGISHYKKSGSNITGVGIISEVIQDVDWVLYKEVPLNTPDADYGLNVYNDAGSLVFSSNETDYMRIEAVHITNTMVNTTPGFNVNYTLDGSDFIADVSISYAGIEGVEFNVHDADNNYFLIIGNNHTVIYAEENTTNTGKRWHFINGIKKISSTKLAVRILESNVENVFLDLLGSGNGSRSAGQNIAPGFIILELSIV